MNVNKQTVVTVGQLKVISIKTPEKILQSVKSSAVKLWTNDSERAYLNVGRFAPSEIRSIWEIWSEKKNAEHFDRIGLNGEKERQIDAEIDQSDVICEKNATNIVLILVLYVHRVHQFWWHTKTKLDDTSTLMRRCGCLRLQQ